MEQVTAVDPPSAMQKSGGGKCRNCGAPLAGRFCSQCGQAADIHFTVRSLFHDLAHGVLHFEGKIWRTLPLLAFKPGELTRRYIAGERARFVSPLALFLFTAFLMFAILSNLRLVPDVPLGDARRQVGAVSEMIRDQIAYFENARAESASKGLDTARMDLVLSDLRGDLAELEAAGKQLSAYGTTLTIGGEVITGQAGESGWLSKRLGDAKQNPDLLVFRLKNAAYKFSWVLVPLTLPLIWLLFARRRDVSLYHHAIFGIYSLSFVSLLAIVAASLLSIGAGVVGALLMAIVPPVHMFQQLRGAYQLGRWSALWRTAALAVMTTTVLSAWIAALLLIG
jgi:Protein of unknown function (DUF3667)